uniref:Uncharacterized protein n=1 Tax=Picea sitchensis TaxID=3332 RepID=A9NZK9_PICSI|nr:unknown [Picea sitchensis]
MFLALALLPRQHICLEKQARRLSSFLVTLRALLLHFICLRRGLCTTNSISNSWGMRRVSLILSRLISTLTALATGNNAFTSGSTPRQISIPILSLEPQPSCILCRQCSDSGIPQQREVGSPISEKAADESILFNLECRQLGYSRWAAEDKLEPFSLHLHLQKL